MNIQAGYQLHVSTWENDGDSSKQLILSGLTENDVKFYLAVLHHFKSTNAHKGGFGNAGVADEDMISIFADALGQHPDVSSKVLELYSVTDASMLYEALTANLIGCPDNEYYSGEYHNFCRVFESFEVFFIEMPIVNVTEKFANL